MKVALWLSESKALLDVFYSFISDITLLEEKARKGINLFELYVLLLEKRSLQYGAPWEEL